LDFCTVVKIISDPVINLLSIILAGMSVIFTYKMATKQNKLNFISNKRIKRVELLTDEIAEYMAKAKVFFSKIKYHNKNEGYNDIAEELISTFTILYNRIILRIDDEYEELQKLAKDIHLNVIESNDINQLGDYIKEMTRLTKEMRKVENAKMEAAVGMKVKS
jgi:hypothetical protein